MKSGQPLIIQYVLTQIKDLLASIQVEGQPIPVSFLTEAVAPGNFGFALWVRSIRELPQELRGEQVITVSSAEGMAEEALSAPPALYSLKVGLVPVGGSYPQVLAAIGSILQCMQDKGHIPVGSFSWIGHDSDTIGLQLLPNSEDLQAEAYRLGSVLYASLALEFALTIGINSALVRTVKRVLERKLSAEHKTVDQIPRK